MDRPSSRHGTRAVSTLDGMTVANHAKVQTIIFTHGEARIAPKVGGFYYLDDPWVFKRGERVGFWCRGGGKRYSHFWETPPQMRQNIFLSIQTISPWQSPRFPNLLERRWEISIQGNGCEGCTCQTFFDIAVQGHPVTAPNVARCGVWFSPSLNVHMRIGRSLSAVGESNEKGRVHQFGIIGVIGRQETGHDF